MNARRRVQPPTLRRQRGNRFPLAAPIEPIPRNRDIYDRLYRQVYRRMYRQLQPLYRDIAEIMGYPKRV